MDNLIIIGLTICSIGVVVFTVIQQFQQRNEALAAKEEQLKQKDEIISEFKNLITGGIGIGAIKRKIRHIDPMFPVHQLDHLEGDSGWKADYETSSGTKIITK